MPGGTRHRAHQVPRDSPVEHGGTLPPTVLYICYERKGTRERRPQQRRSEVG